jgi:hypothetical protein
MVDDPRGNLGVDRDGFSRVYLARNGTPGQNVRQVVEMTGGIESLVGKRDIVILKPNGQWWNQGMTNTDAMKAFIDLVLEIPAFGGEIVVAENHHFPEDNSRGWTTTERNGSFNYNELVEHFRQRGFENVTKCHWHDGGPSVQPSWGGAADGGLVDGPEDGDGYRWCYHAEHVAVTGRKTLMSYPVFTSPYSGVRVDFGRGAWKDGRYLDTPVKFVNFSALNHHGLTGVTASIKNYLGVVDMTCGYRGTSPKGYYNFHAVGYSSLPGRVKYLLGRLGWKFTAEHIGGAVGAFMKTVRVADLNVITAEWVGWGSRTDLAKRARARTVLASRDPVALDYVAGKYTLLPVTREHDRSGFYVRRNDPDNRRGPFRRFLEHCHDQGVGNLEEDRIRTHEHDFAAPPEDDLGARPEPVS